MADDPNKKGADRRRVSQQPHEQAYQKRKHRAGGSSQTSSGSSRSGNRSESTGRSGSNGGR